MPESEINRDEQIVNKAMDYASKNKLDNNDILSACIAVAIILTIIVICTLCIVLRNKRYKKELAEELAVKKELNELTKKDNPEPETTSNAKENAEASEVKVASSPVSNNGVVAQQNNENSAEQKPSTMMQQQSQAPQVEAEQPAEQAKEQTNEQPTSMQQAPMQQAKVNPVADKIAIKPIQAVQKPTMQSAGIQPKPAQESKPKAWPGKV